MPLGCDWTQIKAPLLSLYNMNVPAVPFPRSLCVPTAGGSEVRPGEGPGTLGSDGGFGGRRCVLMGLNGCVDGDGPADSIERCCSHGDPSLGPHRALKVGGAGTEEQGWWGCALLGGSPVLADSPGLAGGGRRDAVVFHCLLHRFHPSLRRLAAPLALGVQRTQVLGRWLGHGGFI